jgi:hypothetical protein
MVQHYRAVRADPPHGPWKIQTVAYYYTLERADDLGAEIFSYHWHPQGHSPITFPHLHIHACVEIRRPDGRDVHFPTEQVSLEDILRLVITDFGVIPRQENWAEVLGNTQAAFKKWRTWP